MNKHFVLSLVALVASAGAAEETKPGVRLSVERGDGAVVMKGAEGRTILQYQLRKPVGSKLTVGSACYFHPFATPMGTVVTDVAPDDHLHHRGVFLAWVEMHGRKDADFWGWGEHAPRTGRTIVNLEVSDISMDADAAEFRALNEWQVEGDPLLKEDLRVSLRVLPAAHLLDLTYALTADADLTLSQWAFSGFCVRARKDGQVVVEGSDGTVDFPNPNHMKPDSDWPDARWYGYTLKLTNGVVTSVAVLNHPKNPPTLWHNHRDIRMLNPCIVAPAAVTMKAGVPLMLRYRVLVHDGPTPRRLLDGLASEWARN